MSKRGQKTTSNEGSLTAKAHDSRSEEISSQSLRSLVNPVNTDEREEVVQASQQTVLPDSNSKNRIFSSESTSKKLELEDQNQTEK